MAHGTDATEPPRSPLLRVFMVEDSATVRELLTERLQDIEGVRVVGCADGEHDAISALRLTPCDIAILDIKLRQGSGIGVLRTLGSDTGQSALYIVFSNYTEDPYRALAAQLGAAHYFDKSNELRELIALITSLVPDT